MGGKVVSVNISERKGTVKHPVDEIRLSETGVLSDAHSGRWHRQVSMLAAESIDRFSRLARRPIGYGEFAENITTSGIDLNGCAVLDRFRVGGAELELTQIGKECHGDTCAIFREVGACVMPKEGIFCRVRKTGTVRPGHVVEHLPKVFRAFVVTLSDRASVGEYEDRGGPKVREILDAHLRASGRGYEIGHTLLPDDADALRRLLAEQRSLGTDYVFTTGGTGIGERDVTVDAVSGMLDRQLPGIMELIRVKYGMENPRALLSRSVAGVMGKSLVYTLPGGVRAVQEYMAEITKTLEHSLLMLHGIDGHHA